MAEKILRGRARIQQAIAEAQKRKKKKPAKKKSKPAKKKELKNNSTENTDGPDT